MGVVVMMIIDRNFDHALRRSSGRASRRYWHRLTLSVVFSFGQHALFFHSANTRSSECPLKTIRDGSTSAAIQ